MSEGPQLLRARAADNLAAAFDLVREHLRRPPASRRRFGAVDAIASGHELAFYNPVLALVGDVTEKDVLDAIEWVTGHRLSPSVHLGDAAEGAVGPAIRGAGFVPDNELEPVMVLTPIGTPPDGPPELAIHVGGAELAESWYAVHGGSERFRATFNREFLADRRVRIAVGVLDGDPVTAAAAFRSGRTLGVYAVATLERARRRGFGRAVTWAAIEAGRSAWDSDLAILQSSEMGVPLYRSMGFVPVGTIRIYRRPGG